ncbi:unnamed protein product [Moneuplotes crassus]|uniref:Uncharacterized protein n=1 Tax=Euplotes crassus TaxID=5936 RepID=A0AAD1Y4E0_EUPCR|nr:unnamed protein product [Moneuplotes crassus]
MWGWIDYFCDCGKEEDIQMDFEPITRTKDPLAGDDPVDVESDGDGDLYDDEDALFEKKIKTYQDDPEMEIGFPKDKQEYEATPCLEEVLDEYNKYTRGRALKPLKKGIGLMLHGDADFFNHSDVEE